jgi:hypothetical protein
MAQDSTQDTLRTQHKLHPGPLWENMPEHKRKSIATLSKRGAIGAVGVASIFTGTDGVHDDRPDTAVNMGKCLSMHAIRLSWPRPTRRTPQDWHQLRS